MGTRSAELREQNRRVLAWSLAAAVVIHVAAFVFWPETPVEPLGELSESVLQGVEEEGVFVEIRAEFAGPEITSAGGVQTSARILRTLVAERLTRVALECRDTMGPGRDYHGSVRLVVNDEGRVDQKEMVEGSGNSCGDRALLAVAGDLWYRWLPSDTYEAPVVLIQPVSVFGVTE